MKTNGINFKANKRRYHNFKIYFFIYERNIFLSWKYNNILSINR